MDQPRPPPTCGTTNAPASAPTSLPGRRSAARRNCRCKWLYDEAGSRLFDRICDVAEYYPTRTEMALLEGHAGTVAERTGPAADLVGIRQRGQPEDSGLMLDALERPAGYVAIDISGEFLEESCAALAADYPGVADPARSAADYNPADGSP